ncbi:MATE family efflux transporter [Bianquea renquensis]|uniref:MATE family efflux transporter n=1 Tax=Bianquea renquensis TaxID=2763661 RepID=UPI003A37B980
MQIITGIVTGLSMGTTVLLGQKIGHKDNESAAQTIGTSIKIFAVLGVVLSVIMIILAQSIARVMNTPEEAFTQTVHYIQICGGGSLCIVAYNLLSAIFRGMEDSKSPLILVSIACVTNIVGDTLIVCFIYLIAQRISMIPHFSIHDIKHAVCRSGNQVHVMSNQHHTVSCFCQILQYLYRQAHMISIQAAGRFVEHHEPAAALSRQCQ